MEERRLLHFILFSFPFFLLRILLTCRVLLLPHLRGLLSHTFEASSHNPRTSLPATSRHALHHLGSAIPLLQLYPFPSSMTQPPDQSATSGPISPGTGTSNVTTAHFAVISRYKEPGFYTSSSITSTWVGCAGTLNAVGGEGRIAQHSHLCELEKYCKDGLEDHVTRYSELRSRTYLPSALKRAEIINSACAQKHAPSDDVRLCILALTTGMEDELFLWFGNLRSWESI